MNRLLFPLALCIVLFGSSSCRRDEALNANTIEELEEKISAEFDKRKLTSISYCVVKNQDIIYSNALGFADEASNKLATDSTRYLIASVSKTITATAFMQLVDQNLVALDDDINTFLPFPVRNPDFPTTPITYRMLLTHRSSISDDYQNTFDLDCFGSDCAMTLEQYFENVFVSNGAYFDNDNFSNAKPGSKEDYSNLASALVGYLVERITLTPFDTYCKDHIFTPLGMKKTEWRLANTPLAELAVPNSSEITSTSPHYTFPDYPNGGLRTTVLDLSIFLRTIIQNGNFNGTQMLSQASVAEMKTLQLGSSQQCLSLYYETFNRETYLGHSGGEKGCTAEMYWDPNTNVGVIVFSNEEDAKDDNVVSLLFNYGENQ